jgi:integrase
MQTKLTAALVRSLTEQHAPEKEDRYWDTALPRFFMRVRPKRAAATSWASDYFIRFTAPDGRKRSIKVGSPATMDLDAARKAARAKLALVDQGRDPASERAELRQRWSVRQAVEAYLASPTFAKKALKVQRCDRGTLTLHIAHWLADVALAELDVPRVRRMLREIETDTRINVRKRRLGGAGAARKAARVLSAVLSWCVDEGQLARNPLIGALRLDGDGERDTVLTEPAQYAALFAAMDALVAEGALRFAARAFITVAALTGMRRGELQELRWGQVNLHTRRITLIRTKGAKLAKRGPKTESVSLPPFAAAALDAIRPNDAADDEQVFVPQHGTRMEINRDWLRVRERAGLPADLTLHGLRHSAGTVAVLAGLTGPEVQKLLRHRHISTTAKYIHLADRTRLQDRAMEGMAPPVPRAEERKAGT